jgi:hypothetical protein
LYALAALAIILPSSVFFRREVIVADGGSHVVDVPTIAFDHAGM